MKVLPVNPGSIEDAIHKSVPLNPYTFCGLLHLGAIKEHAKRRRIDFDSMTIRPVE